MTWLTLQIHRLSDWSWFSSRHDLNRRAKGAAREPSGITGEQEKGEHLPLKKD